VIKTSKILCNQLCSIIPRIMKYSKMGYSISINGHVDSLNIEYNGSTYEVKIIENESSYYWYLKPYNNSFFTTNVKNPKSFEIVLFAIKKNEEENK